MTMLRHHELCRQRQNHTTGPEGYAAWQEWAERRQRTHGQSLCPGCGFWVIWTPKVKP